jgi:hypothetical protein
MPLLGEKGLLDDSQNQLDHIGAVPNTEDLPSSTTTPTQRLVDPDDLKSPILQASKQSPDHNAGTFHFRKRREKSTVILVAIVFLFMVCHSYRLALKIYEFAKPNANTMDSFNFCYSRGRYIIQIINILANSIELEGRESIA